MAAAAEGKRTVTEAYRLGCIGYDTGKTSLIELLTIRRALFEAKGLTIDASLARVRALAALAQVESHLAFEETPRRKTAANPWVNPRPPGLPALLH